MLDPGFLGLSTAATAFAGGALRLALVEDDIARVRICRVRSYGSETVEWW